MKRCRPISSRFIAVLLLAALSLMTAAGQTFAASPANPIPSRYAAIIIDDTTGQVLHQVNPDAQRYPASLTKMMTLYMTFEAIESKKLGLDQRLPVSARAAGMAPSRLGLKAGETLTTRQAILALVTKSANDAAVVLGEALGGNETNFADLMTKRGQKLGMSNTIFRNASGLPNPKQITTARDMATLARALRHDFPQHYAFFKTHDFTFKGVTHRNHNRLLGGFEGTDGLKTGFIQASGFNLAASAVRDNRRLVGVVLGGESTSWRDTRMMHLFDQAFNNTLPPSETMIAGAAPARNATTPKTANTKAKPAARPTVVARTDAAGGSQGDSATTMAALPPNRVTRPAPAKPGHDWAIQVGAFSTQDPAKAAANKAKNKLPKTLKGSTISVTPGSDNLYRARLTSLTEQQAQSACKQLTSRSIACITIAPEAPAPAPANVPAAG